MALLNSQIRALDLGSNTFLCLIAEVENEKIKYVHEDLLEVVRLGQDVERTKLLHPEALVRADQCLQKFKIAIERHKPQKILAMATSAARDSDNRELLFEIGKKYAIPIEIIPGNDEAKITFQGAMSGLLVTQRCLVLDIGGGSTEFIAGHAGQIHASQSLNIGCVGNYKYAGWTQRTRRFNDYSTGCENFVTNKRTHAF